MTTTPVIADCPDAVRGYMILNESGDRTAATALFTDTAEVTDDGHDYRGIAEIRTWLDRAATEYTYTTTPLTVENASDGRTSIRCRLEGNFPGGVVDVDFRFELDGAGRLTRLTITPSADQPGPA